VVARHGFGNPEVWQQLDTSLNALPHDTMWVLRVPVCADAACSQTVVMYAAHWYGSDAVKTAVYDRQAQQTVDFMRLTAGNEPHVLIGDLNAWESPTWQCGQSPTPAGLPILRAAGYIDAWPRIHATAEGFTGMTNRNGCGAPAGYTWKRVDYSWSSPGLEPLDITRFAMPDVPGCVAIGPLRNHRHLSLPGNARRHGAAGGRPPHSLDRCRGQRHHHHPRRGER
jgi:hypothetical protein